MKRIDSTGSVDGKFVDKDLATGKLGTTLKAEFFNNVQEEICSVIEKGAGLKLDGALQNQLLQAIQTMVDQRKKPPVIKNGNAGSWGFPRIRGLVEAKTVVQSDSSMTKVSMTIIQEENFQSASPATRFYTWIFNNDALPLPSANSIMMSGLEWEAAADKLIADVYGMGTVLFIKTLSTQGEPVAKQTSALGQCYFVQIKNGSIAGTSLFNNYCLLIRQLESGSELQPDRWLCDFTYFS